MGADFYLQVFQLRILEVTEPHWRIVQAETPGFATQTWIRFPYGPGLQAIQQFQGC